MSEAKIVLETLDDMIDARSALIQLQASQGWGVLVKLWEQDLETQRNMFAGPLRAQDEIFAQEFLKGAVAQIKSDIGLPAALIDILNAQIDTHPGNKETSPDASQSPHDDDESGRPDERAPVP